MGDGGKETEGEKGGEPSAQGDPDRKCGSATAGEGGTAGGKAKGALEEGSFGVPGRRWGLGHGVPLAGGSRLMGLEPNLE